MSNSPHPTSTDNGLPNNQRPTDAAHSNGAVAPTGSRPGRAGRPPALDSEKRQQVISLLTIGCSRRIAARHVGCAPSTITRTAARDPDFADKLAKAETNLERDLLDSIRTAAKNERYWRAAAWLLERKNSKDYTKRPDQSYSPEQVTQLLVTTLESLREEISPPQRDRAIEKLGTLLLEVTPNNSPHHTPP